MYPKGESGGSRHLSLSDFSSFKKKFRVNSFLGKLGEHRLQTNAWEAPQLPRAYNTLDTHKYL